VVVVWDLVGCFLVILRHIVFQLTTELLLIFVIVIITRYNFCSGNLINPVKALEWPYYHGTLIYIKRSVKRNVHETMHWLTIFFQHLGNLWEYETTYLWFIIMLVFLFHVLFCSCILIDTKIIWSWSKPEKKNGMDHFFKYYLHITMYSYFEFAFIFIICLK